MPTILNYIIVAWFSSSITLAIMACVIAGKRSDSDSKGGNDE